MLRQDIATETGDHLIRGIQEDLAPLLSGPDTGLFVVSFFFFAFRQSQRPKLMHSYKIDDDVLDAPLDLER